MTPRILKKDQFGCFELHRGGNLTSLYDFDILTSDLYKNGLNLIDEYNIDEKNIIREFGSDKKNGYTCTLILTDDTISGILNF